MKPSRILIQALLFADGLFMLASDSQAKTLQVGPQIQHATLWAIMAVGSNRAVIDANGKISCLLPSSVQ
jgi:hypothetical protein